MQLDAKQLNYQQLNAIIKSTPESMLMINHCLGQRYLGAGLSQKHLTVDGTPGNALGAYLQGASIVVKGNVQDAVGDTMNDGRIIIHGNAGDALGYSMRGGQIFVRGNTGYRTGIHMKQYKEKRPVIVIGGKAGSFLGEYLAGGLIIVLGLDSQDPAESPIGNFTGTGMHGGTIYVRSLKELNKLPEQVSVTVASEKELEEIKPILHDYAKQFSLDINELLNSQYFVLTPNTKNPYKRLYTPN